MTYLINQRPLLAKHGVEVEFHPIFLGGINVGSGNKPPWTLPAKARYGAYEMQRALQYFGTMELKSPAFFPILSIVVSHSSLCGRFMAYPWSLTPLASQFLLYNPHHSFHSLIQLPSCHDIHSPSAQSSTSNAIFHGTPTRQLSFPCGLIPGGPRTQSTSPSPTTSAPCSPTPLSGTTTRPPKSTRF